MAFERLGRRHMREPLSHSLPTFFDSAVELEKRFTCAQPDVFGQLMPELAFTHPIVNLILYLRTKNISAANP